MNGYLLAQSIDMYTEREYLIYQEIDVDLRLLLFTSFLFLPVMKAKPNAQLASYLFIYLFIIVSRVKWWGDVEATTRATPIDDNGENCRVKKT